MLVPAVTFMLFFNTFYRVFCWEVVEREELPQSLSHSFFMFVPVPNSISFLLSSSVLLFAQAG